MADFGAKVTKQGVDAKQTPTEANKKDFFLLSSEGCLIEKEMSVSPSTSNVFLGYRLTDSNTRARPLNYFTGDTVYIIYENTFD